jgi:hypothetical protein
MMLLLPEDLVELGKDLNKEERNHQEFSSSVYHRGAKKRHESRRTFIPASMRNPAIPRSLS